MSVNNKLDQQYNIDQKNQKFWNEPCGSQLARSLNLSDCSEQSLKIFDDAFFDKYSYLLDYIPLNEIKGKRVLEVGLGYGSLGRLLLSSGVEYTGMDLSPNTVDLLNLSCEYLKKKPCAVNGNVLSMPFSDVTFDYVISIGCIHHTGDIERAVQEIYRVLKPGGKAIIMVYNKFSFRIWRRWPFLAMHLLLLDYGLTSRKADTRCLNKYYDANACGEGAPQTEFFSVKNLETIFSRFSKVKIKKENVMNIGFTIPALRTMLRTRQLRGRWVVLIPRKLLLSTIGKWLGLDLYLVAQK